MGGTIAMVSLIRPAFSLPVFWCLPVQLFVKVNYDACLSIVGAIGVIIRDFSGRICCAFACRILGSRDAKFVEGLALLHVVKVLRFYMLSALPLYILFAMLFWKGIASTTTRKQY
jgi:hypothetical protein